jgi:hypothetical protein
MLERARSMGAKLAVRRRLDSGTEVELTIPASVAYGKLRITRSMVSGKGT